MSTVSLQKASEPGALTTLSAMLNKYKEQIAMALPRHLTPERMIRVALTAVGRSETLQKCSPATIAGCVVQASILGLEPDGILGEAYLVPFWNSKAPNGRGGKGAHECQLIPGYQGLLKLIRNTGELKMIDVQEVCANDEFDYEKGMDPYLRHKPAVGDRGDVLKIWAGAVLTNGGKQFEVMTLEQIEDHRDRYSKGAFVWKDGQKVTDKDGVPLLQGPWRNSPEWMYKKTVLRKLVKLLPKSAQAQLAVALDERAEVGIAQRFTVDVPIELQQSDTEEHAEPEKVAMPERISEADAKAEAKKLRKLIADEYDEQTIDQHSGGKDLAAMTLEELTALREWIERAGLKSPGLGGRAES